MYIEPLTNVTLCSGVPLDPTYEHTILFENVGAQLAYFSGKQKKQIVKQTYQRFGVNRMRVELKSDDIYDCNYLFYQNENFGNKYFYAFITNIEYVNNIVSEITYELDIMQTWLFDYTLKPCFVEREHSVFDLEGANRVPESLETGEYVAEDFEGTDILGNYAIVIACTFDSSYADAYGGMYGGVYSGLNLIGFPNTVAGANAAENFIKGAGSKSDGIFGVFLIDQAMASNKGSSSPVAKTVFKPKFKDLKRADGQPVHNKKLLEYPYNYLYVTNLSGDSKIYKYENFASETCGFQLAGDSTLNPSVFLSPIDYEIGTAGGINYDQRLVLTNYPHLPYATDTFRAWLAQEATNGAVNALTSAGSGMATAGIGIATANPIIAAAGAMQLAQGGIQAATGIINMGVRSIGQVLAPTVLGMADKPSGGNSGAATAAALGKLDFCFMRKHIKPEFVSIIDDYFDMFGYATHRVKVPNRNSRPHWNYVKTIGCNAIGSVPADDMAAIKNIYDKGVTFWKKGSEVGDYTLDNTVGG